MSSGLSEEEIREILAQARARDVVSPARGAPAPQPEPSPAGVDDASEYLELPPIDERAPPAAGDASAPPANSVFGEMAVDLALPDEAETRTTDNPGDGPAP